MRVSPGRDRLEGRHLRLGEAGRPEGARRPREGHAPFRREGGGAPGVVAVLVGQEDGVERGGVDPGVAAARRARAARARRRAARARPALDEGGVAAAARAEDAEAAGSHDAGPSPAGRQPPRLPRTLAPRPAVEDAAPRRAARPRPSRPRCRRGSRPARTAGRSRSPGGPGGSCGARALEREHQAALEVVLRPPQLVRRGAARPAARRISSTVRRTTSSTESRLVPA